MVVQRSGECRVGRQYLCQISVSVFLKGCWSRGVGSAWMADSTSVRYVLVCVWLPGGSEEWGLHGWQEVLVSGVSVCSVR